jgi:hypothetical protein
MSDHGKRIAAAIAAALSVFLLTACASGGGGGGSTGNTPPPDDSAPPPEEDSYVFAPTGPAGVITKSESGVANPSEVVAVLDSGVDLAHDEFRGDNPVGKPIVTTWTDSVSHWCSDQGLTECADPTDVSDEAGTYVDAQTGETIPGTGHGTGVASLIAGKTLSWSGNSQIAVYDISDRDDGAVSQPGWITTALRDAADHGNRVANLSYAVDMVSMRQNLASKSDERADIDRFVNAGAVLVAAAGNGSENYSHIVSDTWDRDLREADSLVDQLLVVGALAWDQLATYSDFAGENPLVQERFLVTQGSHQVAIANHDPGASGWGSGTSYAAPVVSAALATLLSKWDHLTPEQAANRLLATTDRTFANQNAPSTDDYGKTSCGESGDVDCGLYTYGQGRLDFASALAPAGIPAVATAASVPDAAHPSAGAPISETALMLPAGLGSAGDEIAAAVSEVEVFDDLGRNYSADLSGLIRSQTDPTQGLGFKMSEFLAAGLSAPVTTVVDKDSGIRQMVAVDAGGRPSMAAVGTDAETLGWGLTAYHFGNGASAPDAAGVQGMGMVSYSGDTPMANQIDSANGVNVAIPLAGGLSLTSSYWQGEKRLSLDETGRKNRISNIAVGLEAGLIEGVDLTAGYASLDESDGFMGMTGMGGFATDSGSSMDLIQLGLAASLGGFRAFANYQSGQARAAFGNSLITHLDAEVEQMAVGASYGFDQGRRQIALVASRPMHVTGGTAAMRLAADRSEDGRVIYRHESVAFSGAEAPMNYEIGYRQRIGKRAVFGFNAMRMENAPNLAAGGVDHGAMAMIRYGF